MLTSSSRSKAHHHQQQAADGKGSPAQSGVLHSMFYSTIEMCHVFFLIRNVHSHVPVHLLLHTHSHEDRARTQEGCRVQTKLTATMPGFFPNSPTRTRTLRSFSNGTECRMNQLATIHPVSFLCSNTTASRASCPFVLQAVLARRDDGGAHVLRIAVH